MIVVNKHKGTEGGFMSLKHSNSVFEVRDELTVICSSDTGEH